MSSAAAAVRGTSNFPGASGRRAIVPPFGTFGLAGTRLLRGLLRPGLPRLLAHEVRRRPKRMETAPGSGNCRCQVDRSQSTRAACAAETSFRKRSWVGCLADRLRCRGSPPRRRNGRSRWTPAICVAVPAAAGSLRPGERGSHLAPGLGLDGHAAAGVTGPATARSGCR